MAFHKIFVNNIIQNEYLMINIKLEDSLNNIFAQSQVIIDALQSQDYELFKKAEKKYSKDLTHFLNTTSKSELTKLIPQLKKLEQLTGYIQGAANDHFEELKKQSLAQQRNKKKINAYK